MNSKTKKLIIAAAALVLLIGGYFTAQAVQKKKAKSNAESPYDSFYSDQIRLTDFNTFDIAKIELPVAGIILEKIDDKWELIYPRNDSFILEQYTVLGKLWSMANLGADSIIEESPDDLSQYGLDEPAARALITDINGTSVEILFGGMNPGRNLYYVMVKDDPKIYTAYPYAVENFLFSLDALRSRELIEEFDPQNLLHLILENSGSRIEVFPNDESSPLVSPFSLFMMTSPYSQPRGTDNDKFGAFIRGLPNFRIEEFVDDAPASLAPYGLASPGRLYFEVPEGEIDLRFGTGDDGKIYFKLPDKPGVFTIPGYDELVTSTPFNLADKFVQLHNITAVSDFTVTGEGKTIRSEIVKNDVNEDFFVNGRKASDQEFRQYYQAVIGLLVDAEFTGTNAPASNAETVNVIFNFNNGRAPAPITLNPYNRDFYAVTQNGFTEFMVSRSQVRKIFDSLDKLIYEN